MWKIEVSASYLLVTVFLLTVDKQTKGGNYIERSKEMGEHAVNQTNWTAVVDQSNEHVALKLHQSNNNIQL